MADDSAVIAATARAWLADGHRLALATVTRTWGSAPRRTGAHLLIREDGLFEGSVSGGCVEGDVVAEVAEAIDSGTPKRLHYGVADAAAWEVGLACGGEIEILLQPVASSGFPPELFARVESAARERRRLTLFTDAEGRTRGTRHGDADVERVYLPPLELILVGAVHIAQALAPIARELGYRVRIVDPRGAFARAERFAGIEVDERWPDEAIADWGAGPATAVAALTHDPKLDDPALAAALKSEAFYIAALGSKKTHAARLERLDAQGFGDADLARIHGPAGLAIGAANPAEIALSVAAEMVAAWHGKA